MDKWNLYVLRYDSSGNYYVGTTPNFDARISAHLLRISPKNLPKWSVDNRSIEGFKYYWFTVDRDGVSQSDAEHCEYDLAELIVNKIKMVNNEKFIREVHVGNGKNVDGEENSHTTEIKFGCPNIDLIDTEIEKMLNTPKPFELETKTKTKNCIKCIKIDHT